MAELLKNRYNASFFNDLCQLLYATIHPFDEAAFRRSLNHTSWDAMELKQRMYHIAECIADLLPPNFSDKAEKILQMANLAIERGIGVQSFEYMFLPHIVEIHGRAETDVALKTMMELTQFVSCEFAVRPFIMDDEKRSLEFLKSCTTHPSPHVRRWASEGCRPLLPWSIVLTEIRQRPEVLFPILNRLMTDSSEYVRRSVANNLNDISKDHPAAVINFVTPWHGRTAETDKLIKHGLRTLLKSGHVDALNLFGLGPDPVLELINFHLSPEMIQMGEAVELSFEIHNSSDIEKAVRLEYAMYFLRSSGERSKKVFKISERSMSPGERLMMSKKHTIKPISTRRYYSGIQEVSVIVNGSESESKAFKLQC